VEDLPVRHSRAAKRLARTMAFLGLGLMVVAGMTPRVAAQGTRPVVKIQDIDEIVFLGKAGDEGGYRKLLETYLRQAYPELDTTSPGYSKFAWLMGSILKDADGSLIPPIFNGNVASFNMYQEVAHVTSTTMLPPDFKAGLDAYWAKQFMIDGYKDIDAAKKRVASIPVDSYFVTVHEGDRLDAIVAKYHPQVAKASPEEQKRVYDWLVKINPWAISIGRAPGGMEGTAGKLFGAGGKGQNPVTVTEGNGTMTYWYILDANEPIAIPKTLPK